MSGKRKEYKVDAHARKAALFFLACEPNPDTRLSIPAAMRAKGYSDAEAADRILVQQVRRESQNIKSNDDEIKITKGNSSKNIFIKILE